MEIQWALDTQVFAGRRRYPKVVVCIEQERARQLLRLVLPRWHRRDRAVAAREIQTTAMTEESVIATTQVFCPTPCPLHVYRTAVVKRENLSWTSWGVLFILSFFDSSLLSLVSPTTPRFFLYPLPNRLIPGV